MLNLNNHCAATLKVNIKQTIIFGHVVSFEIELHAKDGEENQLFRQSLEAKDNERRYLHMILDLTESGIVKEGMHTKIRGRKNK
jgi:hypothetical protein